MFVFNFVENFSTTISRWMYELTVIIIRAATNEVALQIRSVAVIFYLYKTVFADCIFFIQCSPVICLVKAKVLPHFRVETWRCVCFTVHVFSAILASVLHVVCMFLLLLSFTRLLHWPLLPPTLPPFTGLAPPQRGQARLGTDGYNAVNPLCVCMCIISIFAVCVSIIYCDGERNNISEYRFFSHP